MNKEVKVKRTYNEEDFKFEVTPQKLRKEIIDDYEKALAKKTKDDHDKMFIQVVKQKMKTTKMKLVGTHIPSGIKKSWPSEDAAKDYTKYIPQIIELVKLTREQKSKEIHKITKKFDGATYFTTGGVFVSGGLINAIGKHMTSNDPFTAKAPRKPKAHYIGIELEFNNQTNHSVHTIGEALKKAGLSRYVHVGQDGSCGGAPGVHGFEVRVLLEETKFEETLTKICKVIKDLGFKTDPSCGTHIHLDMRNRDVKKCYANLFKAQLLLRKFLTSYRKKNIYCVKNSHSTYEEHIKAGGIRRSGINTQSYDKYKTLEIRMHQGTLEVDKLIPWIKLLTSICNYDGVLDKGLPTLKRAKELLKIEDQLFKDLSGRLLNRKAQ